ncbi:MAG: DNA-binding response regulator [Chloroflexi bacterium HGW-Chloroflexi-1]|nr:MAG: DNA-binding response regulator [Chloroflexi bacterium HGW-Chloroflexi-1]
MRILLVEDEPALAETVDYALAAAYDVIILDVMLPGLDGFTVCRRLRDEGVTSHILMLTALTAVDDRVYGLDSGADDYLTKPFAFREMLARLRALGRRTREIQIGPLQVADLTLDEATHEVRRGARQIDLSPLEFRLLHCLLRHTGQVLTRDVILDRVWNFDYAGGSNVVDVYIRYLRRKIEAPDEPKLLHTVRGVGYKLAEDSDA